MGKFQLLLTTLIATGILLLLPSVSQAASYHDNRQFGNQHAAYAPGTAYYTISTQTTAGTGVGTIAAVDGQGGLTLHINADGTFLGQEVTNPHSSENVSGNFQDNGAIFLTMYFGRGTYWHGKAQSERDGRYIGKFVVTFADIILRSGLLSLVPVFNPAQKVAIDISAIATTGPEQGTPFGGVMILDDHDNDRGKISLPDGSVVAISTHIVQSKMSFTFHQERHQRIVATGTSSILGGTVVKFTGTFVGPLQGDTGTWYGYPFTFAA